MLEKRAHTYVDAGNARVGTPWSVRCWSAFLGNTVSIQDRQTDREWLACPSDEIDLTVEGCRLSLMDFQGGIWSEECNPHGAVLACRLTGKAVTLFVRCTAMHESPGLLRELALLNRTRHPLAVSGVILDRLALALPSDRKDLFRRVSDTAVTAGGNDGALLIGHGAGVDVEVDMKDAPVVTLRCNTDFILEPGQTRQLPDTHLLPYRGAYEQICGREYAAFLCAVRDLRSWEDDSAVC